MFSRVTRSLTKSHDICVDGRANGCAKATLACALKLSKQAAGTCTKPLSPMARNALLSASPECHMPSNMEAAALAHEHAFYAPPI